MKYDEDKVLTNYIWDNYYNLMTLLERSGAKVVLAEQKAAATSNERLAAMIRDRWGEKNDPNVVEALRGGPDVFRRTVRDRILRDKKDQVFINRCPKCSKIVRTPKAEQCFWCGHDWHEKKEAHNLE